MHTSQPLLTRAFHVSFGGVRNCFDVSSFTFHLLVCEIVRSCFMFHLLVCEIMVDVFALGIVIADAALGVRIRVSALQAPQEKRFFR